MRTLINHLNDLNIDYRIGNDKAIKEKEWQKSDVKVGKYKKGDFIGIILKEDGIFINGKMLGCIDIDAKNQYGNTKQEQDELFKNVIKTLDLDAFYQGIEQTINGGYHIFFLVDPKESMALKNHSIIVEYQKCKKKAKKEIEIFVNKRYMVTSPSSGYKTLSGTNIDFSDLIEIDPKKLDDLKSMSCVIEKVTDFETVEENTGKKTNYLLKAYDNIKELDQFKNGEWAGYNFVKEEIFRFYIALNKEDEFLKIIKNNHPRFFSNWEHFPSKYLEVVEGNRSPSKNSSHLDWLKSIGVLKKQNKKDQLKDDMDVLFESIAGKTTIKLGDSVFVNNGRSYEWLNPLQYGQCIYNEAKKVWDERLNKDQLSELIHHFTMYIGGNAIEFNPADKLKTVTCIPLSFKNGTLYVHQYAVVFKENFWQAEDKCFIEFCIDYNKDFYKSYFTDWVEARFDTEEKRKFFRMTIGDLFATGATTDVHAYFWGGAGIGKSTISSLLQKITTRGTVDFMKLDKIKDKFSRVKTLRTPILIADEASERNIPESEYKSTISREADDYEMKNVQNFNGQPIAKFLTFANILPNIKMDAGVKRRLCVLEVSDKKIHTDLSELEFAEKLGECENEMVDFIIKGIQDCFNMKWRISKYYQDNFGEEKRNVIEANDNFSYFLDQCFIRTKEIENDDDYVISMDAYKIYNSFLNTLEGTAMHKMTVTKFGTKIKELGFERKRKMINNKRDHYYVGLSHSLKSKHLLSEI